MSDFLEDEIVKHIFRAGTFNKPTVLATALLTTPANDADTGTFTTGVEVPSANGYARVDRPPSDANWTATAGGDGQTDNAAAITYTQATADWASGANIQGAAICDSATHNAGQVWFHGSVTTAKPVLNGDTAEFAAGAITVTFA